jgi:checkpoint serine/threonine-protein kinase
MEADSSVHDENASPEVDLLADSVAEKLVVHHDVVMLDENGAPILPREGKSKKKRMVEANETQISECCTPHPRQLSS